MTIMRIYNI